MNSILIYWYILGIFNISVVEVCINQQMSWHCCCQILCGSVGMWVLVTTIIFWQAYGYKRYIWQIIYYLLCIIWLSLCTVWIIYYQSFFFKEAEIYSIDRCMEELLQIASHVAVNQVEFEPLNTFYTIHAEWVIGKVDGYTAVYKCRYELYKLNITSYKPVWGDLGNTARAHALLFEAYVFITWTKAKVYLIMIQNIGQSIVGLSVNIAYYIYDHIIYQLAVGILRLFFGIVDYCITTAHLIVLYITLICRVILIFIAGILKGVVVWVFSEHSPIVAACCTIGDLIFDIIIIEISSLCVVTLYQFYFLLLTWVDLGCWVIATLLWVIFSALWSSGELVIYVGQLSIMLVEALLALFALYVYYWGKYWFKIILCLYIPHWFIILTIILIIWFSQAWLTKIHNILYQQSWYFFIAINIIVIIWPII